MESKSIRVILAFYFTVGIFMLNLPGHALADEIRQESPALLTPPLIDQKNGVSTKEIYAMVKKPTMPIELLQNIKFALDHQLLQNEDFYTDENMKSFLGGRKVFWEKDDHTEKRGGFVGLDQMVKTERKFNDGISFSFDRKIKENGQVQIELELIIFGEHPANFDAVEKIFGTDWHYPRNRMVRGHGEVIPSATQPHGNAHIEYLAGAGDRQFLIETEFDHNASLSTARFFWGK